MKKKDVDYLEEAFYKQSALDYLFFADILGKLPPDLDLYYELFDNYIEKDVK